MLGDALFERAVREGPGDPAFLYFDTPIETGEAAARARRLAGALRGELGLRPGDRVALMLQNVPQFPIAVHAVWRCGGVVTAVNPMNKERELRHQLADSGARIVVCLESLHPVVEAAREGLDEVEHVVTVSELDMLGSAPPALAGHERLECPGAIPFESLLGAAEGEAAEVSPDDPALITYTSGTTGTPKGAIGTHAAVAHTASAMVGWGGLAPGDVTVAMAPLFHITGLICHMATARASTTPLLLLYRFEAGEILRLIERWRGTYVIGPLTAFIAMLDHPSFAERDLSSLTKVASGGAPVYPAIVERWSRATGTYLHNTYGLTETAAPSHLTPRGSRAPVDPESGALSVGLPIAGNESRVVVGRGRKRRGAGRGGRDPHPRARRVTRLLEPARGVERGDRGRLAAHRRHRQARRGRLVLPRRPHQGHDQRLGLQGLAARGRGRAVSPPGRRRGLRGGRTRRLPGRVRRGVRRRRARAPPWTRRTSSRTAGRSSRSTRPRAGSCFVDEIPKTATGKALRRELRRRAS